MRTARALTIGGGVPAQGCTCQGGVPSQEGVPAQRGVPAQVLPTREQIDRQVQKYYIAQNFVCGR